jgi:catechol 2,3-dioxygenase-like lactoylglutathione lyase family enzyme
MMIKGLSHITFVVRDLDLMTQFLQKIFDATEIYDSGNQTFSIAKEKFFLIGQIWIAVMEGDSLPEKSYNHVAFSIADDDFDEYAARVKQLGLEVREDRRRVKGEGRSLYFYDYDNHLFELHTGGLSQRLERYEQD